MRILSAALLVAGLTALAGCGKGRGLVPVSGTVLMDGAPLNKATITFVPDGGGELASGISDDAGRFFMVASGGGEGVLPGNYKVTVMSFAETPAPSKGMAEVMREQMEAKGAAPKSGDGTAALKKQQQDAVKAGKAMRASPAVYNDIAKTPLKVTVPVPADYKIELSKDAK